MTDAELIRMGDELAEEFYRSEGVAHIIRALVARIERDQWRPIDEAPLGVLGRVWVADAENGAGDESQGGRHENGESYAVRYSGPWKITHYRPLPAPPEVAA